MVQDSRSRPRRRLDGEALRFYGGTAGVLAPFGVFLAGVAWLAFAGAPDERGFWPVLLAALALGLLLSKDRTHYAETVVDGMSRPIVMLMIMAWLLAGVLAAIMNASGFVEGLVWLAGVSGVAGGGFVVASFVVCCIVSTATGTSLGTVLLCSPLLYPAGVLLGAHPGVLIGAILGGATFGDNISPVSDTTIASASTQGADLGGVVRSRLKYAFAAAAFAVVAYGVFGGGASADVSAPGGGAPAGASAPDGDSAPAPLGGTPVGLVMLLAPAVALALLLRRRHLLEGLTAGIATGLVVGLTADLISPADVIAIDADNFIATGLVLDGMERGVGVSVFTFLLMGLAAPIEATGLMQRVVDFAADRTSTARGAEVWIFTTVAAAVALTTHSAVAILTVGGFAAASGRRFGIGAYRRANILDMTVCTFPFVLPFFIPVVLAASTTAAGAGFGVPRVSLLETGLYNFHSWALLGVVILSIVTGFGRDPADPRGDET